MDTIDGQMVQPMMETGLTIIYMDMVHTRGQMDVNMWVNGKTINFMEEECIPGKMEEVMKVSM
jgi:hypothetical protein